MDKTLTDALAQHDLVVWTRSGKHYAVTGHRGHEPGIEHHITDAEFEELKALGAKVEHAPHQVNG
jgi:predicted DNA-binding protein (MmcQ/YjbR family)